MKRALFGIGREAEKYYSIMIALHEKPDYAFDNSKQKQGTFFHDIEILSPERLSDIDCEIVISCGFKEAITAQLSEMGLENKIIDLDMLMRKAIEDYANGYISNMADIPQREENIVIDAFDGIGWGGMEIWSYEVARELLARGLPVRVFGSDEQVHPDEEIEKIIVRRPLNRQDVFCTVEGIIKELERMLPFILIDNWSEYVLYAAFILKKVYPESVKIISMQHNDVQSLYEKKMLWEDVFERLSGVSKRINYKLTNQYGVSQKKIFYKENFLTFEKTQVRRSKKEGTPIIIGWGARLERYQKRADLIAPFIETIEDSGISYTLNIAGNGPMYTEIYDYVQKNGLEDHVNVLGAIPQREMVDFWENQDIYLNLSDFEGCSLAMLEAMSVGCVPVVTNVSGTDEFVFDKETGFCVEVENVKAIIDKIVFLSEHLDELIRMSVNASEIVRSRCQKSDYVEYLEKVITEVKGN